MFLFVMPLLAFGMLPSALDATHKNNIARANKKPHNINDGSRIMRDCPDIEVSYVCPDRPVGSDFYYHIWDKDGRIVQHNDFSRAEIFR